MPLRYVRELTAAERAELAVLYKSSPVAAVVRRSHAVLLSADGWAVLQIAGLLRVNQATIHGWLDRFAAAGSAGLPTQWSDGRRRPGTRPTNGCWSRRYAAIRAGMG